MKLIHIFCLIAIVSGERNNGTSKFHRVTHIAWFDIKTNGIYLGRIEIGLFGRIVPETVTNFVNLSTRKEGYKNSIFHLIKKNESISGGDWIWGNGKKGLSSFVEPEFKDENFKIKHYGAGWVSAHGYGKDRQTSIFIITLDRVPRLDGLCVVFGKVINGMNVVWKISEVPLNENGKPVNNVIISDCGAGPVDPPFFTPATDATD